MNRYRLYFIEGSQLRQAVPIEAEDDENAVRFVAQRRFGRPCELWDGERLVERFDDHRPDRR